MLHGIARFVTGRRTRWAVIGVWVAVIASVYAFDLPSRFDSAQDNDPVAFLPEETESVQALRAVQQLPGPETQTAIVVARADGQLTGQQRGSVDRLARRLREQQPGSVVQVGPPEVAPDGTTAVVRAQLRVTGDADALTSTVARIRDAADGLAQGTGLQVAVTGPAGIAADLVDVFSGIGGTLLLAAGALVIVLLLIVYRSPVFWLIPIAAVLVAEQTSRGLGWLVAEAGLDVNGQSAGILTVLVFGAGTDYALLIVARFREELRVRDDVHEAAEVAISRAFRPVLASAATVAAALLVLLFARVQGTASLGPLGAVGIALAFVSSFTLLPALMTVGGRRAFWPFVPSRERGGSDETHGFWRRLGERVVRRARLTWVTTTVVLLALTGGVAFLDVGLTQADSFRNDVESIRGQRMLEQAYPPGTLAPTTIVVRGDDGVRRARDVVSSTEGVASASGDARQGPAGSVFEAVLQPAPYSDAAFGTVERVRDRLDAQGLDATLVGGPTAQERDYRDAAIRDFTVVPPIVLAVVAIILALLLRAILLPLLLVAASALSFGSALGVSTIAFELVFGFAGLDPTLLLIGFLFLVALGVDYSVFLMARTREETPEHGTREGMLRALAVTGAVITSAGIVLAGTFATLAVLPLVVLTQIGVLVAVGVLIDALIVRATLNPALVTDLGPRVWWPSDLAAGAGEGPDAPSAPPRSRPSAPPARHRA